jgi:hypothetical protein
MIPKFVDWIAHTFEGGDGKASFRKMTAFILIILNIYLLVFDKLMIEDRVHVYYANLLTISIIIGIVTTQNILAFLNRGSDGSRNEGS